MKRLLIFCLLLTGCSSHHPYIPPDQAHYGPPQWQCDINNNCALVRYSDPPQLTQVGCFLNQWTLGLGHKAEECIKPKKVTRCDTCITKDIVVTYGQKSH
jgi:hypothetical protein